MTQLHYLLKPQGLPRPGYDRAQVALQKLIKRPGGAVTQPAPRVRMPVAAAPAASGNVCEPFNKRHR